jgi:hypothetical protein
MRSLEVRMPSSFYLLFAWAAQNHIPLFCRFEGLEREFCPIIVGHTNGEEKALVWQTGGETSKGPLPDWRCFSLSKVEEVELRPGDWATGRRHGTQQKCVAEVDYDANEASPYNPTQSFGDLRNKSFEAAMLFPEQDS